MSYRTMRRLLLTLSLGILCVGGATGFVWDGIFNVAATEGHAPVTLWLISQVRDRSIAVRADDRPASVSLTDLQVIQAGFRSYHTMCLTCHSAPGRPSSPVRQGLNPKPPRLTDPKVQRRSDGELHWILQHGIRMTGMPAFSPTHSDDALWALVAFLRHLPALSPQAYTTLVHAAGLREEAPDPDALPKSHDHDE